MNIPKYSLGEPEGYLFLFGYFADRWSNLLLQAA